MKRLSAIASTLLIMSACVAAQGDPEFDVPEQHYSMMEYRLVGPHRGGRAVAVAGFPDDPFRYLMGSTGGGVWETDNGGDSWKNISDGFFKTGSVGAIAVADSDPNVIYVGMGEAPIRGVATSHGDGVYRSDDSGKTWTHIGLSETQQISRIQVHPDNADVVFVAAQGHIAGPNPERGIYRSTNGGSDWELVLHVDDRTGASDLSMDPQNPRNLYAAMWEHQRLPWKVISGGEGSGVYKSSDGGTTWTELTNGLPDFMGKIGIAVSPANPERVFAIIEAEEGGLFRSDDAGKSWKRYNKDRLIRTRSWYYTHITADPKDEETVYVMNAPFTKSIDGGKTFTTIPTPHGDNHCLWINPENTDWMINCNDGGANISYNAGKSWSRQSNQPTAQFYRVNTDNLWPYNIYGGQQDNSSMVIASESFDNGIDRNDWHPGPGCESAYIAFDENDPNISYGGCYEGIIGEYNHASRTNRDVMAYPFLGLGADAKDHHYRFNWNAPIVVSSHDPKVIYHAAQMVLKSSDRGQSWSEISPDLSRNEIEKQGKGGGPITNEAAGAEWYNTIMYIEESQHEPGTLYVGTDDGKLHITRDEGGSWTEITPPGLGEGLMNSIDVSPHDPASAFVAYTDYKLDDFSPHVLVTRDYGATWRDMVDGIGAADFVRVVREDPDRKDLLYAGTETGIYVSFNGGEMWQPFQQNLPVVPITDLMIRQKDLVVATSGRSFWVLDDLSPLHELTLEVAAVHVYKPDATPLVSRGGRGSGPAGKNPPNGVLIRYHLDAPADSVELTMEIANANGEVIRTLSSKPDPNAGPPGRGAPPARLLTKKDGMNSIVWDFRTDGITKVPKQFTYGSTAGYRIAPGTYQATLKAGDVTSTAAIEVIPDPRQTATTAQYREQQAMLSELHKSTDEIHKSVNQVRDIKSQITGLLDRIEGDEGVEEARESGEALIEKLNAVEEQLIQPRQETFQDVINFPNRLNAQFMHLLSTISSVPPLTSGQKTRMGDLREMWSKVRSELDEILETDIPAFNEVFKLQATPAVILPG